MKNKKSKIILILILTVISVLFIAPIVIVFMNSFKSKLFINSTPFAFPNADSFVGLANYGEGMIKTGFLQAFFITLFITVASVFLIVVLTSMTAWYLVRVKSRFTKVMYYLFAFAMIVPFQMVMFTLVKVSNMFHLDNLIGIIFIYVGFGAGLSVFMFTGFIKSIPVSLEEAAMIDGCSIMQIYFKIVFPVIRPIIMTVAILNAMWIWNDYLLPYLVIGSEYKTASDEVNNQIQELNNIVKKYDKDGMLIGEAPATKDLIKIMDHDFNVVSAASIGVIFILIALVLKSISLPVILVAVIEFAIFVNMGIPAYTGTVLPFIASIVIGTIQLGATVDYAILMTTRYKKERSRGKDKKEAVYIALSTSMKSIIVSALGFFAATIGVGLYSKMDMISSLCILMSRGAIISMFTVILVLPSMFMLFDKLICKTSMGFKPKKS